MRVGTLERRAVRKVAAALEGLGFRRREQIGERFFGSGFVCDAVPPRFTGAPPLTAAVYWCEPRRTGQTRAAAGRIKAAMLREMAEGLDGEGFVVVIVNGCLRVHAAPAENTNA